MPMRDVYYIGFHCLYTMSGTANLQVWSSSQLLLLMLQCIIVAITMFDSHNKTDVRSARAYTCLCLIHEIPNTPCIQIVQCVS